jgi:tRNA 2-thiouridine synthesizing protein A
MGLAIADMIGKRLNFCDSSMTEKILDLRGLKCPLPALRTRKALAASDPGDLVVAECTDPLAGIDIPHLVRQTGDALEDTQRNGPVTRFCIRKR